MRNDPPIVSKILILDNTVEHFDKIKQFCDDNSLIGLRIQPHNILKTLNSHVDLGGILMAEDYVESLETTLEIARKIRSIRPELPIILRRSQDNYSENLVAHLARYFTTSYTIDDLAPLQTFIDNYIFNTVYPNEMIRGITEITVQALESQLKEYSVNSHPPYLVKDRIIMGDVFTMIPIESNWCRGYMMLETESSVLDTLVENKDGVQFKEIPFRDLNNLFSEITNLIWGSFKNRFVDDRIDREKRSAIHVPIVSNHLNHYISFGSENPQLCFKYTLYNNETGLFFSIYQWFIFNLNFTPELFEVFQTTVDDLLESGELELFTKL